MDPMAQFTSISILHYDEFGNPTPTSNHSFSDMLNEHNKTEHNKTEYNGAEHNKAQNNQSQVAEEFSDLFTNDQPSQAEQAQYFTPSETMSSPSGSLGELTPSPESRPQPLHKRRQSGLRNQYVPSPTTEAFNTGEMPFDLNNNSACEMSTEMVPLAGNGLQSYNNQADYVMQNFTTLNDGTFTNCNDQSNMGLHCGQNLGYQDPQLLNYPHAALLYPNQHFNTASNIGYINPTSQVTSQQQIPAIDLTHSNQPFNTGSNIGYINPTSQITPQQQNPAIDLTHSNQPFNTGSNIGYINPTSQITPQQQNPATDLTAADDVNPYTQGQISSQSSHMMSNNCHQTENQKATSRAHRLRAKYYQRLLNAMKDVEHAQDNAGMLDTWEKMMNMKKSRIEQVCQEMVEKAFEAQHKMPAPLGENGKNAVFNYDNVEDRIGKLELVLKTQKTVCKHLLEDSYINQVVTDPENAQKRVENNRRVNYQKKQAIEEGRKRMGTKGRGKGVPIRATNKTSPVQEESGDECLGTSGNTNNSPENQGSVQGGPYSNSKRTYSVAQGDDDLEANLKESPSKRAKNTAHSRTKSASALTINTVAASPMNTMGAPRTSAHRHSNSYPGFQPMPGNPLSNNLVRTPTSGLPPTIAAQYNEPDLINDAYQGVPSGGSTGTLYHQWDQNTFSPLFNNPYGSHEGLDLGGYIQSPYTDK